jgi:hypothetical protein
MQLDKLAAEGLLNLECEESHLEGTAAVYVHGV